MRTPCKFLTCLGMVLAVVLTTAQAVRSQTPLTPAAVASPNVSDIGGGNQAVTGIDPRTRADQIQLTAGQVVRPKLAGRAMIIVPSEGWTIDAADVRFERIDFVIGDQKELDPSRQAAMLNVTSSSIQFSECSWHGGGQRVGVRWRPANTREGESLHLRLEGCMAREVAAWVDSESVALRTIEVVNSLHLGAGPLIRMPSLPVTPDKTAILIEQSTLRGARALVEVVDQPERVKPGRLAIHARDSIFAPGATGAIVRVTSRCEPVAWLHAVTWTGQGSILANEHPAMAWILPNGRMHAVAENAWRVAGLVRGKTRFAGENLHEPTHSLVVDWSAPIIAEQPPGILSGHFALQPPVLPMLSSE